MAGNSKENLAQFERANNVQEISSADEIYSYDACAQQAILHNRPWNHKLVHIGESLVVWIHFWFFKSKLFQTM